MTEIAAADGTSTGTGLVGLTGKASPLVRWGDRGMRDLPVMVGFLPVSVPTRGPKDALVMTVQLDAYTEADNTGLAWKMADRCEAIFTQTAFASTSRTNPVDVIPYLRVRRDQPELDEGRMRVMMEFEMRFNR